MGVKLDAVFLYERGPCTNTLVEAAQTLLDTYRVMAGRVSLLPNLAITLNDAGVTLTETTRLDYTLERALQEEHDLPPDFCRGSSIPAMLLGLAPLMRITVTRFRDGAAAVGVWCSHGICDGDTYYAMIDAWASIARSRSAATAAPPTPTFNQSLIPRATRSMSQAFHAAAAERWGTFGYLEAGARMAWLYARTGFFLTPVERLPMLRLSPPAVARVKLTAELASGTSLTTQEALSAFVSQLLARAIFRGRDGVECTHVTMFNWRERYGAIPSTFAGNASSVVRTGEFASHDSLGRIALQIHDGLFALKTSREKIHHIVELFVDLFAWFVGFLPTNDPSTSPFLNPTPACLITNNFTRYAGIYRADFGTGPPVLVVPHRAGEVANVFPLPDTTKGVAIRVQGLPARLIRGLSLAEQETFLREAMKFEDGREFGTEGVIREWFSSSSFGYRGEKLPTRPAESPVCVFWPVNS